jgi:NTE family protein
MASHRLQKPVALVLGGGGVLGASQVGMLRALDDAAIHPDLVLGTSVGAINGAALAANHGKPTAAEELSRLWEEMADSEIFAGSLLSRTVRVVRTGTHLHSSEPLWQRLVETLGDRRIEDLPLPFQCVAASIERAREHWFSAGPVVDAVLASCAVPGLLEPVRIDGEHFMDGGLVASVPVDRAIQLGARTVFVLHVGRLDTRLHPPRRPWEVAVVAFEIARRHRYETTMANLPEDVCVHVLPTGTEALRFNDRSQLRYRDFSTVPGRIHAARESTARYLQRLDTRS